jgi:hypothetical protein
MENWQVTVDYILLCLEARKTGNGGGGRGISTSLPKEQKTTRVFISLRDCYFLWSLPLKAFSAIVPMFFTAVVSSCWTQCFSSIDAYGGLFLQRNRGWPPKTSLVPVTYSCVMSCTALEYFQRLFAMGVNVWAVHHSEHGRFLPNPHTSHSQFSSLIAYCRITYMEVGQIRLYHNTTSDIYLPSNLPTYLPTYA